MDFDDKVQEVEEWMMPYWQSFQESKYPVFGIWICQHITQTNMNNVYKWFCKQYSHKHFVFFVPVLVNPNMRIHVHSFIQQLENV